MFSYTLSEAPLALSKFLADCFTKMPLWSLCLQNKIWASSWTCRVRLTDRTFTEAYTSIAIMLSPLPNALKTAKFYFRIFGSKARIWFFLNNNTFYPNLVKKWFTCASRLPKLWYSLNDKKNKQKCELIVRILYVKRR